MALMSGKNASIKDGTTTIARMSSFDITFNNTTIDAIVFDTDWVKCIGGIQGATASVTGFMDVDSTAQNVLTAAATAHTMMTTLRFYVDGTKYYSADTATDTEAGIYIESFNITAETSSIVSFNMSLKFNGPCKLT